MGVKILVGVSYSGSTYAWGVYSIGSIPVTPTKFFTGCPGDIRGPKECGGSFETVSHTVSTTCPDKNFHDLTRIV